MQLDWLVYSLTQGATRWLNKKWDACTDPPFTGFGLGLGLGKGLKKGLGLGLGVFGADIVGVVPLAGLPP